MQFYNRVEWARSYLKIAGLVHYPSRGCVAITDDGLSVLKDQPEKITIKYLKQFPAFQEYRSKFHKRNNSETVESETEAEEPNQTPDDAIDSAYEELRTILANELLEKVISCSPDFFEKLVVDLLIAMGYGGAMEGAGEVIGKSGDGGIDGLIKEDKLGLDVVSIQAKRWQGTVGRPVVQAFAGSMDGVRAKKGVMLTTSNFSKDAEEYVENLEKKIVLIDGPQLAELMIDHNVGISTSKTIEIKKMDMDYFSDDE